MNETNGSNLTRHELDDARHALSMATAWLTVMDAVMPVSEEQCTRIAAEFVRLKSMSDADIEAARRLRHEPTATETFDPMEVEALARAICLSNRDHPDKEWLRADGRRDIRGWQIYEDDARAAIRALREVRENRT
jgi:hypothetical protein